MVKKIDNNEDVRLTQRDYHHGVLGSLLMVVFFLLLACKHNRPDSMVKSEGDSLNVVETSNFIERVDTNGVILLYPIFSNVDLVCGIMPLISDSCVILVAEAAYTGELLDSFRHSNIAGDHVSHGIRYKGYRCKRNTGAFVYYNGSWNFHHQNYSKEMDLAAEHNGCAFAQEMIIHKGQFVNIARNGNNVNQFRALCNHHGRLCIAESAEAVRFGDFKQKLFDMGVSEALYLDMGVGWNYAWYREKDGIVELHPRTHNYCTNWITFYK